MKARNTNRSSTASRTLKVLEFASTSPHPVSAAEVAEYLDIPKIAAHRSLMTLVESGYLIRGARPGIFERSLTLLTLTRSIELNRDVEALVADQLESIGLETGEACTYEMLEKDQVVVVHRNRQPSKDSVSFDIGQSCPIHCTSSGKAILAFQPRKVASKVIEAGMERFTGQTIVDPFDFLSELDAINERGFSISDRECSDHVRSVAAPIFGERAYAQSGLRICGEASRISLSEIREYGELLKDKAQQLSRDICDKVGSVKTLGNKYRSGAA